MPFYKQIALILSGSSDSTAGRRGSDFRLLGKYVLLTVINMINKHCYT